VQKLKILFIYSLLFSCLQSKVKGQENKLVELSGVIMSADSLGYLPYVSISVLNQDRGTIASNLGVFTLIAYTGDTLEFSSIGYRNKKYIIPKNLAENRYSIIQLMVQDTFFLPETIIRPGPSKDRFDYAFKYWEIPDDKFETARKNTDKQYLALLSKGLARDGHESQNIAINNIIDRTNWQGQRPPQNIFSPLAWSDFIKAWKRGDFRRKKNN
jgi:D-alanyl-lipoteichoic acid acyltransferase DltB (MBOAT superfamily)